jgi:TonB family protein
MPLLRLSLRQLIASILAILTLLGAGALWAQQAATQAPDSAHPEEVVYKPGNGVTRPKPVFMPDPPYTDSAARKKIHGEVLLKVIVTMDGNVRDVQVVKALEESLDRQSVTTVSTWRFEPGTKDGKPVAVEINVEVTFNIQKDRN